MDIESYLRRIGYCGPREPTTETLKQLHRAHMLAVPFENLDILLGRPITLSLASFYDKIVQHRRGGFCYELNGLFGWLLEQLGFTVVLLSAQVFNGDQPGPEFDHLVLLVEMEERLIADVGFGDSFLEPLRLDAGAEDVQYGCSYRLIESGTDRLLQRRRESTWESQYVFSLTPHQLAEFSTMCEHQQTSLESAFKQKSLCSLATRDGRITLSNNRLIVTAGGQRQEQMVADEKAYRNLLKSKFGIEFKKGVCVDILIGLDVLPN
ncbi:arylamine N-acetyltransferase [Leptolyngbyaceae cyanobacterium CCMR0082]|uniref:Arylamine N-acetyltransferase n=2 Tax=Adonisia turfae TaxID=2950184 RepID=A0A6M0S8R7_9CYAN|nr:arylamine N-acetyltransferase [Adonisia turfae]MDV3350291.1 arylamine N-acetyltransferase [Leptothoe sp. LEGE 181152]NEZ60780.1 arylamine N-acetyltransferase [Adonisia turfae CCMR0081]NEZ64800.1 arylamine N-acetyltransferase [Adonisia turfae CCMR0082]